MDCVRSSPATAIPIVLKVRFERLLCDCFFFVQRQFLVQFVLLTQRLKDKGEEWKRARLELSKGWKEELEKNYPKSLDHRSFYFKQADKKQISAKALVLDIKTQAEEARSKAEPNPRVEVSMGARGCVFSVTGT